MSSELTPSKRPHDEVEGEANGKGKLQKSEENKSYKHSQGSIVFRVLCPDAKTTKISEIHGANIRVEEAIPGCNERVVVIGKDTDKPEEDNDLQKALLLVFESMVDNDMDESIVVMRLLVVSNQVGCLLGKSGASESGAQIRILPKDKLPACASSLDELVQISGEVSSVRKAVEYFSQQLLEHPSNDSNTNTNTTISQQDPPHGRGGGGRFGNLTDMLTYRLICPDEKVGGVIGKGGAIVKALKHETGCDIKVLERILGSDDRVIVISGPAVPNERICAPQDAVLRVQTRIFRAAPAPPPGPDSKGVTAKVIVSAHQIGCILGKGGSVISEMRKSTGAFIRILGKDQTPLYAAENQEVVQINGEFEAVQEALFQITTALRNHYFRDAFPSYMARGRPRPISPPSFNRFDGGYGLYPHDDHPHPYIQRFPWGAPQGIEGGFSEFGRKMGGFGGGSHQAVITNTTVEVVVPRNVVSCIYGEDGGCLKQIREISDARITITDPKPGAKETLIVISGTPEQAHAAQSLIQAFVISETQVS